MTIIIDKRHGLKDQPGVHALIIGVSRYPHLPGGSGVLSRETFGLSQITMGALSACKFFNWLINHQRSFTVPLSTVRVLLSPTPPEMDRVQELCTSMGVEICNRSNFEKEVRRWRQDACTNKKNITFFYYAGLGIGTYETDVIFLFENFGVPNYPLLRNAASLGNIYNGMTVSFAAPQMALTQFYFIDTNRNIPKQLAAIPPPPVIFDRNLGVRDNRTAPIFYAAVPGSPAYGITDRGGIFTEALLRCLDSTAAEPTGEYQENKMLWRVSVRSVDRALESVFDKLQPELKKANIDQAYSLSGLVKDATICLHDKPPPIGLVYDTRDENNINPGIHALIVGISKYRHLPGGKGKLATNTFGMQNLNSAAISAYKFYQWLLRNAYRFSVPLSTIRLLLVPSTVEMESEPKLKNLDRVEYSCTLSKFLAAATEWRIDSSSNKDNIAIFYFAGHGAQRQSKRDSIFLLEDFSDGVGGTLKNAIEVENLFNGMAPSPTNKNIAGFQLYFIDACRVMPSELQKYEWMNTTPAFNVELGKPDDRYAPIFFSSVPGDYAYGLKGKQTLFNDALLHCLNESAIEMENKNKQIHKRITVNSLNEALDSYIYSQNQKLNTDQNFVLSGNVKNITICSWVEDEH